MYKIAFATPNYNPQDIRRGSGSYYHLTREIICQGHDIKYIGPIDYGLPLPTRIQKAASNRLNMRYRSWQDIFAARRIGNIVMQEMCKHDCDFLLTNDYSVAGFTPTTKPIILYTDAVFPADYATNNHPWLDNLFPTNVWSCQYVNRRGLSKVAFGCFPTTWAVNEIRKYNVLSSDKIKMIPFGANLETPSPSLALRRSVSRIKAKGRLDLLFIGKDWELKGGKVAVSTVEELLRRNINATLHIVGCSPQVIKESANAIKIYGMLDKDQPADKDKLIELFQKCDVFLLPTKAEGFGIVFAEAAAYGLPSLAFNVTGVATSVNHGISGHLIEADHPQAAIAFAEIIVSWLINPDKYEQLVVGARNYHDSVVNWKTAVNTLVEAARVII